MLTEYLPILILIALAVDLGFLVVILGPSLARAGQPRKNPCPMNRAWFLMARVRAG